MEFIKRKAGVLTVLVCLLLIVAVVWFCLEAATKTKVPEGTLVKGQQPVTTEVCL